MKKKATTILLTVMLLVGLTAVPAGASAKIPDAPDPFYAADFAGVLTEDTENYIIEKMEYWKTSVADKLLLLLSISWTAWT